jgi:hypothetical protein
MNPTSTHTESDFTLKEKIQYTIFGVLVLGGSFFVGRKLVRKAKSNTEEKKTFQEGNSATYAKQIKMAFENDNWFGWGTDEEALRKTLRAIPSKDEFRKVINSYQNLYSRSMMKDMQDELTTTEYNEMLAIIGAKPERGNVLKPVLLSQQQYLYWAKRLKAAFDITYGPFPGTDEDAIKAVFMEIPSQAAFVQVGRAYKQEYSRDLITDLKGELEFWEYAPMMQIINTKPKG